MAIEEANGQDSQKNLPPTFQDVIMNLQRFWAKQGCVVLQPYDTRWAQARSIRQQRFVHWVPMYGALLTCSRAAVRPTVAMAKTRIVCSIITNSRC